MTTESRLQYQCFTWHWNSFPEQRMRLWMNHNNPKDSRQGAILKGMGLVKGVSDLSFLRSDGRIVFIELKLPGQKQKKEQKEFEKVAKSCNAFYSVVTSFVEFEELIKYHAK